MKLTNFQTAASKSQSLTADVAGGRKLLANLIYPQKDRQDG
jgi:hypothetical protein